MILQMCQNDWDLTLLQLFFVRFMGVDGAFLIDGITPKRSKSFETVSPLA